jgi:hypothetical protein
MKIRIVFVSGDIEEIGNVEYFKSNSHSLYLRLKTGPTRYISYKGNVDSFEITEY